MSSIVNGYYCRNCADVELAKKGMDPANPGREYSGGEVYVPPSPESKLKLGVNEPEKSGTLGTLLNLRAQPRPGPEESPAAISRLSNIECSE